MTETDDLKERLKSLLESAESVKALAADVREDLLARLMGLTDEQTEALIRILEEEKEKVSVVRAKLTQYGDKITDLFGKARQAGRELKVAFLKAKAEDQSGKESESTEALLEKL